MQKKAVVTDARVFRLLRSLHPTRNISVGAMRILTSISQTKVTPWPWLRRILKACITLSEDNVRHRINARHAQIACLESA